MIEFRLDARSGVTTYLQLVQQVRHAIRLGRLQPGDQLPTIREVVRKIGINPNTVLKAYRDLEREGLVTSRPGQGTFVLKSLRGGTPDPKLNRQLERWIADARASGLDDESIKGLLSVTLHETRVDDQQESVDTA